MIVEDYILEDTGYNVVPSEQLRAVAWALADQMEAHTKSRVLHVKARRLTVA